MYTKLIQRAALIVVGLLFIVPLALLAAPLPTSNWPLLKSRFKSNLTITDAKTNSPITGVETPPRSRKFVYWVVKDEPFTLKWAADGVVADGLGERSESGMVCTKSWESSTRSNSGPTGVTGSLSTARTLLMTCAGLGGGVITKRDMKVGTNDLTVTVVLGGETLKLKPGYTKDVYLVPQLPITVDATVKNNGRGGVSVPSYSVTYRVLYGNRGETKTVEIDESLPVGQSKQLESFTPTMPTAAQGSVFGESWSVLVTVDERNTVRESDDNNNDAETPIHYFVNP